MSILCQLSPVCTSVCEFLFVFVEELCLCLNVCTLVKALECVSLHVSCLFLLVSCLCLFVCLHWCVLVFKWVCMLLYLRLNLFSFAQLRVVYAFKCACERTLMSAFECVSSHLSCLFSLVSRLRLFVSVILARACMCAPACFCLYVRVRVFVSRGQFNKETTSVVFYNCRVRL